VNGPTFVTLLKLLIKGTNEGRLAEVSFSYLLKLLNNKFCFIFFIIKKGSFRLEAIHKKTSQYH
jgi:hypothetical protein